MLPTRGVPLLPKGGVPLAAMGLRFKTESHGETGAAGTGSTGHSNPRYATGGNGTAHRTPTAGAVRAESACGNPRTPLA